MASSDINVAVEKAIHEGLRNVVQNICDQYGIRVNRFAVQWNETSSLEHGRSFRVMDVIVESQS